MLVDDAIVEIENIAQHRAMGKTPRQAAIDAADEIGIAVIATSATLAATFVPVAFMPGEIGLYFREFGWTAATAVLFSLLVARLLTPMLAAHFLGANEVAQREPRWMPRYLAWVEAALRHRLLHAGYRDRYLRRLARDHPAHSHDLPARRPTSRGRTCW